MVIQKFCREECATGEEGLAFKIRFVPRPGYEVFFARPAPLRRQAGINFNVDGPEVLRRLTLVASARSTYWATTMQRQFMTRICAQEKLIMQRQFVHR